jgi:hypothetical protein
MFMAGAALCATSAFAAQNVANTSQKGSLLIYASIDVSEGTDTIVRMSNDSNLSVTVKCYYMNEKKGRRDFSFKLTKKQPVWWSVYKGYGTLAVPDFPDNYPLKPDGSPLYPGDADLGELICWAVSPNELNQISFNHLSGTATIYEFEDGNNSAFEYNSWNFTARNVAAGAAVGTAGRLDLTGSLTAPSYDACPQYLIGHFSPADAHLYIGGGRISVEENELSVVSCNQDLRQDYTPHFTKLQLTVWNEAETRFTGAYKCSDGYHFFDLTSAVAGENFTYSVLKSGAAQFKVLGVQSTQCVGSEASGLVGVLSTEISSDGDENEIGTTLNTAGVSAAPGYVLWDPELSEPPERR